MSRWKSAARRGATLALCLAMVAVDVGVGQGDAAAAPVDSRRAPAAREASDRILTLVTGDRVRVHDGGTYTVEPGPGRQGMVFHQQRSRNQDLVIPADALGLVGSGRVDSRLFDVPTLLRMRYDDAATRDLPLIVAGDESRDAVRSSEVAGATVRELPSLGARAVRVPKSTSGRFWASVTAGANLRSAQPGAELPRIWLDGRRTPSLDQSVAQVGAPSVWQSGQTGRGVRVAVLDTGIDATHPDFAGRIAEVQNFTDDPDVDDVDGHGTHVASIVAGSGAASQGRYRGVAPEATLLVGKVCGTAGCPDSAVIAGMEWATSHGAAVVNLSLGGLDGYDLDPMEAAVNRLTAAHGTLFVAAAGNDGLPGTVSSPASADAALAVGAVDRDDRLADFSSQGPRTGGGAIKPEITAPGVGIVAARAARSEPLEPVDESYTTISGTSQATPHVAGAAALLAGQHPDWRAAELKATLVGAAVPNPDLGVYAQGAGRLDVAAAATRPLRVVPAVVDLGRPAWPHTDDAPTTSELAYHNSGSEPLTLSLTVQADGPGGVPAPAGMFEVRPSQLTVPAGGSATAILSADTRRSASDGVYVGSVVAAGAGQTLRTLVTVEREPESYNLTLSHLDRAGDVPVDYTSSLDGVDVSTSTMLYDEDGTVTVRLPRGRYHLTSTIRTGGDGSVSLLTRPELALTADTTLTLDARVARPAASVTVPRTGAQPMGSVVGFFRELSDGTELSTSVTSFAGFTGLFTAHLGAALPAAEMRGRVLSWWGENGSAGDLGDGAHLYHLAWYPPGRLPSGFERQVRESDLAVVQARHVTEYPGTRLDKIISSSVPGYVDAWALGTSVAVPAERTEYYSTETGVRWSASVYGNDDPGQQSEPTAYPAGPVVQRWQQAPFGPGFPAPAGYEDLWMSRTGDRFWLVPPMFSDQTLGHAGFADLAAQRRVLLRDGREVLPNADGDYEVPAAAANYRFTVEAERPAAAQLSTRVSASWTFRSGRPADGRIQHLPVQAVRFAPDLDGRNAAPAGREFRMPVRVQRQAGADPAGCASLTVDVSYDDGRTWRPVRLVGTGADRVAVLTHPTGAGFVSLRAAATDTAGNTVQQTIIRAYRLAN
ncbi:S8 family serine peptidase [Plantactinospora sp. B24E8]|uniref:S8 family serine peptidase n=1 Tax=Plantactinospora sp. B24E8 TaxID=3153567 RepID=UPI00325ED0A1